MKNIFLILVILYSSFSVFADTSTTIVTVTTDKLPTNSQTEAAKLNIIRDANGSISWFEYIGFDNSVVKYSLPQLKSKQVLASIKNHDVSFIILEPNSGNGNEFDFTKGVYGELFYLYSGVSSTYYQLKFKIVENQNNLSIEFISDSNKNKSNKNNFKGHFNRLFMKNNVSRFFGVIGIEEMAPGLN
jgi:hypothetical protein